MRIGLDLYSIGHLDLTASEALEFAAAHGVDGLQFLDPSRIDAQRRPGPLAAFRDEADRRGLYLEVGLSSPNPVRRSRREDRAVTAEEHAADLRREVEAVAALGCRHARAYVGDRHDRFRTDVRWPAQIAATREVLRRLSPVLRSLGIRVALETHADLTADELLRLVDDLGDDVAAITLDTGNLAMRLDDPLPTVERLAPWVVATHIKDAVLAFTDRGLCWQARPVGAGMLPMADLIAVLGRTHPNLNLSVELHPRTYDLPIFDPSWLAFFPDLRPEGLAAIVRLAHDCERRYAEGSLERPEDVEAVPWSDRAEDWLARSVGYLRSVVGLLPCY